MNIIDEEDLIATKESDLPTNTYEEPIQTASPSDLPPGLFQDHRTTNLSDNAPQLPPLPSFRPAHAPSFRWGDYTEEIICQEIHSCYESVVKWNKFFFSVHRGAEGAKFVNEMGRMLQLFANGSGFESISLKAAMILPSLMLMKPSKKSKAKEERLHLKRRLELWEKGELRQLKDEAEALQRRLSTRNSSLSEKESIARCFGNLLRKGKLKDAMHLLKGDTLKPWKSTDVVNGRSIAEILQEKHPDRRELHSSTLTETNSNTDFHPIVFESINATLIRSSALKVGGSAGPSGLAAKDWRRICTSFNQHSADLCDAIAAVTKRLCTEYVDPNSVESLMACRLIALNKNPGVRPIGVSETLRRIIGKAILTTIADDVQRSAGSVQLCAGQVAGIEAATHAMNMAFEDEETEAAMFVDASNAFNNLNREAALRNIHNIYPALAIIATNTYRRASPLFYNQQTIQSKEGTTQGDPLAMAIYAVAIRPLIDKVKNEVMQIWFADDAAAAGKLTDLKEWWEKLSISGPDYGYFPNALKTVIVTKPEHLERATNTFSDSEVTVTIEGTKYLGAPIGSIEFTTGSIEKQVTEWIDKVKHLAIIAKTEPQATYAAFTHSLIGEWTYFLRTVPVSKEQLTPLEDAIKLYFIPSLTGRAGITDQVRHLISLPTRLGGLGIIDPRIMKEEYARSKEVAQPVIERIRKGDYTYAMETKEAQRQIQSSLVSRKRKGKEEEANQLKQSFDKPLQRVMTLAQEKGASHWLNALPLEEHGFSLHNGAFRDGLCLRYGWKPDGLPTTCACGQSFSVDHALSCNRGGFPILRHNELRDITGELLSQVCHNVSTEPHLQPLNGEELRHNTAITEENARLDLKANGMWGDRFHTTFFDVRVFNPHAASYRSTSPTRLYQRHEKEKLRAYNQRIIEVEQASFSPLIFSATGGMGHTATTVYQRLAALIAKKKKQDYNKTLLWIRSRLSFALLRAAIMCLRGTRQRSNYFDDAHLDVVISESRITSGGD